MGVGPSVRVTSRNLNPKGGAWSAKWHPEQMVESLDLKVGAATSGSLPIGMRRSFGKRRSRKRKRAPAGFDRGSSRGS